MDGMIPRNILDDFRFSYFQHSSATWKIFLGGQFNQFSTTDKYMKKTWLTWGKPCIFLSNEYDLFNNLPVYDKKFIDDNCIVVKLPEWEDPNHQNKFKLYSDIVTQALENFIEEPRTAIDALNTDNNSINLLDSNDIIIPETENNDEYNYDIDSLLRELNQLNEKVDNSVNNTCFNANNITDYKNTNLDACNSLTTTVLISSPSDSNVDSDESLLLNSNNKRLHQNIEIEKKKLKGKNPL